MVPIIFFLRDTATVHTPDAVFADTSILRGIYKTLRKVYSLAINVNNTDAEEMVTSNVNREVAGSSPATVS